jgi:hypothetical protein
MAAGTPLVMTQLIAGTSPAWLVTVPLPTPVPPPDTFTVNGPLMKRAVAVRLTVIESRQVPLPVQEPDHALKECPLRGTAVSVTVVP